MHFYKRRKKSTKITIERKVDTKEDLDGLLETLAPGTKRLEGKRAIISNPGSSGVSGRKSKVWDAKRPFLQFENRKLAVWEDHSRQTREKSERAHRRTFEEVLLKLRVKVRFNL